MKISPSFLGCTYPRTPCQGVIRIHFLPEIQSLLIHFALTRTPPGPRCSLARLVAVQVLRPAEMERDGEEKDTGETPDDEGLKQRH